MESTTITGRRFTRGGRPRNRISTKVRRRSPNARGDCDRRGRPFRAPTSCSRGYVQRAAGRGPTPSNVTRFR